MGTQLFMTNKTERIPNELFDGYSNELLMFASVSCILFIIVGVPGNLLTIIALSRGKQTRNSTAIFIINLSFSDLLFGCFNLPLAVSTFLQRAWIHSDLLCRLFPLLRYGLLAVSLFTISLITINRYIIIAHPRQYPRIYQRKFLAIMVGGTWLTAFSIMIPTWRGVWGKFGLDIEIGSCSILHDENNRSPKEFLFVTAFIVPCICIVICYARIFYLVRKAAVRTREQPAKNISFRETAKQQQQNTISPTKIKNKNKTEIKENLESPVLMELTANVGRPFVVDEDIDYIDVDVSSNNSPLPCKRNEEKCSQNIGTTKTNQPKLNLYNNSACKTSTTANNTTIKTSLTRFKPRKSHYVSMGNTSNASAIYPGKMSAKDKRLLKMILVIFVWFVICYLPITITKTWKSVTQIHIFNINSYLLVYLTTCINPLIYVLMSSEYRRAYLRLLKCETDLTKNNRNHKT